MREDYLWDKTGEDGEIETLESTLSAFRYKPVDPPALPDVMVENSKPRFWWLRSVLVPAAAACGIGTIAFGVWLQGTSNDEVAQNGGGAVQQSNVDIPPRESKVGPRTDPENGPITSPGPETPVKVTERISGATVKSPIRTRRSHEPTFTREEKEAYDKLMLALSITSSKLRLVQDKANGLEIARNGSKNDNK